MSNEISWSFEGLVLYINELGTADWHKDLTLSEQDQRQIAGILSHFVPVARSYLALPADIRQAISAQAEFTDRRIDLVDSTRSIGRWAVELLAWFAGKLCDERVQDPNAKVFRPLGIEADAAAQAVSHYIRTHVGNYCDRQLQAPMARQQEIWPTLTDMRRSVDELTRTLNSVTEQIGDGAVQTRIEKAIVTRDTAEALRATYGPAFRQQAVRYSALFVGTGVLTAVAFFWLLIEILQFIWTSTGPTFLQTVAGLDAYQFVFIFGSKVAFIALSTTAIGLTGTLARVFLYSAMSAWHRFAVIGAMEEISRQQGSIAVREYLLLQAAQQVFRDYQPSKAGNENEGKLEVPSFMNELLKKLGSRLAAPAGSSEP